MNCSLKFNNKFACMMLLSLSLLIIAIALIPYGDNITYANSQTAEIIFPSSDYIQSSSPSLISANENFLLVFDEDLSALFVKNLSSNTNHKYNLNFSSVDSVLAVYNSAFINADDKIYKINLLDEADSPKEVSLLTPKSISTLSTDGTYLYAKSQYGQISVYYDDLAIAFEADNILNDIFLGKTIFVGNNNMVYTFTFNLISNIVTPYINSYNLTTKETVEIPFNYLIQNAYIGDALYAQVDGQIIVFNKHTTEIEISTNIKPDSFYATGNKLYAIEGEIIYVYEYNSIDKTLTLTSSICMSGNDYKHLNNPKSMLKLSDLLIIADSNNKRISYIDSENNMTTVNLDSNPTNLCSSSDAIFALCENNTVNKIVDKKVAATYSLDGIKDITYLDRLYAIKNDGIYILLGGKFVKYLSLQNCTLISSYSNGNMVYAISNDALFVISKDGKLIKQTTYDFSSVTDFNVDYEGNIYVLKEGNVSKIKNTLFTLSIDATYSIPNSLSLTANSFTLDGSNIYLTCDECVIVKDTFASATKENTIKTDIDLTSSSFYYAIRTNVNSIAYNQYAISDSISIITDDIIYISSKQLFENYYYAKIGSNIFIVDITNYNKINEMENTNIYKLNDTSPIYKNILEEATSTISKDEQITAISQISIIESTYIKFNIDNIEYYVDIKHLSIVEQKTDVEPEIVVEPEKNYGKVQASRVGEKVSIYSSPSNDSTIIDSIKDGTKIELLSEDESYYYISYNGIFGYIGKDNVIKSGVTKIQLIAIILSVIVVVAGVAIFLSYFYFKKKSE